MARMPFAVDLPPEQRITAAVSWLNNLPGVLAETLTDEELAADLVDHLDAWTWTHA